jgi:uncharacterized protein (DUF58 family)
LSARTAPQIGIAGFARRIQGGLHSRFARILGKRAGRTLPILLTQKKLYVLPTGFGFFTAAMLFLCVLGGLNYNNNLALAFAFLFCALAFLSVHVAHRNLLRLEISHVLVQPAFADGELNVDVGIRPSDARARTCLRGAFEQGCDAEFELPCAATVRFALPAARRGWQALPPLTISTQWPFGLFRVWAHVWPDAQALIYPKLEANPPELPIHSAQSNGTAAMNGDEDLRNLRAYRPGDAPRQIAWRASARAGELRTRELETPMSADVVLDDQQIQGLAHEAKLSRLAAWCMQAEQANISFTLHLNGQSTGSGIGTTHLGLCLRRLALAP